MKFWLAVILALMALQTGPTMAAPWRELRAAQDQSDRYDRGSSQRRRDTGRPDRSDRREERRERPQRLSDEERRELHRDLDKARREIYKPRRDR